jgi:CxxC motif-containing protein (DUF1111 family)
MLKKLVQVSIASLFVFALSAYANFGDPLPGLTAEQLNRFITGQDDFETQESVSPDGLGPVFNENSCVACHIGPAESVAAGAVGGTTERKETRFGRMRSDGSFDPMTGKGGSLIQDHGIGVQSADCNFVAETVPPDATVVARRRTTPLFGLGLVDAVPDSALHSLAIHQPEATRGMVSTVFNPDTKNPNTVGRFGWKAQVPTLHVFAGDAYLNEMGITNPSFPDENCPQGDCGLLSRCNPVKTLNDDGTGVQKFADFMTFLAPPPQGQFTRHAQEGARVFGEIGCAHCHTPILRTGASSVAALDRRFFFPFSDFLLHDMGQLGDEITQNLATGRLMRTQPLWGLRAQTELLHDGRAAGPNRVQDAILAHDGQGRMARDQFARLRAEDAANLVSFLNAI